MYDWLVLTDLDGTLLNKKGELDPRVVRYVHELHARKDLIFCFSTGRSWEDCRNVYEELDLDGFVSCCNGAHILHPKENIHVYSFISESVWTVFLENDDFFTCFNKIKFFTDKGTFTLLPNEDRKSFANEMLRMKANVYDIKCYFALNLQKDSEAIDEKIRFLKSSSFLLPPSINIHPFMNNEMMNIEIQAPCVSKQKAVEYIGNYYGVPDCNILTYGDQVNDLAVAQGTSYFTAVKNAIGVIKQYADNLSAYSNDECAVIEEIKIILNSLE